jgi:hypothetical protein
MAASRVMLALVLGCVFSVVQAGPLDKIFYTVGRKATNFGYECVASTNARANILCEGGMQREMTSTFRATNVIPQVANVYLRYEGGSAADSSAYISIDRVSLVDNALNGGTPCASAYASAAQDSTHSGEITPTMTPENAIEASPAKTALATGDFKGKMFKVPQTTLLDATKTFRICYRRTVASTATWYSSGIDVRVSKIQEISVGNPGAWGQSSPSDGGLRRFRTSGTVPNHAIQTMYYRGTVLNARWISFVDETLASNNPCTSGAIAAGPLDSAHSGSMQGDAGTKTFHANTAALSGTKTFAVCYAESGGITSSQWRDSGIRIKRSMVTSVERGVQESRFGKGFRRSTFNRNPDDWNGIATDTFPQFSSTWLTYNGELGDNKYISLVDQTLGNYNPCQYPLIAAQLNQVTGPTRADASGKFQGGTGTSDAKTVNIQQTTNNFLKEGLVFAVCYSNGDGTTSDLGWADSYARFSISKIESLTHHSVFHTTSGVLPLTGAAGATENLMLGYYPSPELHVRANAGDVLTKFALVDANANSRTVNGIETKRPCEPSTANEWLLITSTTSGRSTGEKTPEVSKNYFELSTDILSTGTILNDNSLGKYEFALCYTETGNLLTSGGGTLRSYTDSGIRLTVGKLNRIMHGVAAASGSPHGPRIMKPVEASGQVAANAANGGSFIRRNGLPIRMSPTTMVYPAAWADATRPLSPGLASARNVIPQTSNTLIEFVSDPTHGSGMDVKRYCASVTTAKVKCDTDGDGAFDDTCTLNAPCKQSDGCNVDGSGCTAAANPGSRFVSLVDAALNGNKPCDWGEEAAHVADAQHSGSILATYSGSNGKFSVQVPQSTFLNDTKIFAVCYALSSGTVADTTWADSYVRLTTSKVTSVSSTVASSIIYSVSKYDGQIASRTLTTAASKDADVRHAVTGDDTTGSPKLDLTYTGQLDAGKYISLVQEDINSGFPCATITAAGGIAATAGPTKTAGADSTAMLTADSTKTIFYATKTLNPAKVFAVCYSENGAAWRDSGIRFERSRIYSMRYESGYANYWRDQTSVFLATNRIPITSAAPVPLEYIALNLHASLPEVGTARWVQLVDASTNSGNPCVAVTTTSTTVDNFKAATGTRSVSVTTAAFTEQTTYAVCYATGSPYVGTCSSVGTGTITVCDRDGDGSFDDTCIVGAVCNPAGTNPCGTGGACTQASPELASELHDYRWVDSYIRLKATQIGEVQQFLGQWTSGSCIANQVGCEAQTSMFGAPDATGRQITGRKQVHKTWGQLPQMMPSDTGLGLVFKGKVSPKAYVSLVAADLNPTTSKGITYHNPCDNAAIAAAQPDRSHSGPLASSGKGFCVSVGSSPALTCDTKGDGNFNKLCELGAACDPSLPGNGCDGECSGAAVSTLDSTTLDKTKTFALCYTRTDNLTHAPAGSSASTWGDSGIRLTISKIRSLYTSSRYPGIASRVQTSIFKPTNRIPNSASQYLTYHGTPSDTTIWFSLVPTTYTTAWNTAYSANTDWLSNPCVQGAVAGAGRSTLASGALAATGQKIIHVSPGTLIAGNTLTSGATYAVCYSEDSVATTGTGNAGDGTGWWLDSGIRFGVTDIESLRVIGIDVTTTGQVPNTDVSTLSSNTMGVSFTYAGTLANNKWISLVRADLNNEFPCASTEAGKLLSDNNLPSNVASTSDDMSSLTKSFWRDYSGSRRAGGSNQVVSTITTRYLLKATDFAVCYATTNGLATDATFADSGIRVQVTKVWNVRADSGNVGGTLGACPNVKTCNGDHGCLDPTCKTDTKPRDQTSWPLATNRFANVAGQTLEYVGTLGSAKWLSLVHMTRNPSMANPTSLTPNDQSVGYAPNPCVDPAIAAAAAGPMNSGPERATGNTTTFSSTNQLNAGAYFCSRVSGTGASVALWAACNPEVANVCGSTGKCEEPTLAVCYAEINGTTTDPTWRDSYIRLKITEIEKFVVKLPSIAHGTLDASVATTDIPIRTVGQIPDQDASKQVSYDYSGSLAAKKYISLVDAQQNEVVDILTGMYTYEPCMRKSSTSYVAGITTGNLNSGYTGQLQAAGGSANKTVKTLDTRDGAGMKSSLVYALCYNSNTGGASSPWWHDSGIRITVTKLNEVQYFGTNGDIEYCSTAGGANVAPTSCNVNFQIGGAYNGQCAQGAWCKSSTAGLVNGGCGASGACTLLIAARRRPMTSEFTSLNQLPQVAGINLVYQGALSSLSGNKYISLVAAEVNTNNPCVNPHHTGANPSTRESGSMLAGVLTALSPAKSQGFTIPQAHTCASVGGSQVEHICSTTYGAIANVACAVGLFCDRSNPAKVVQNYGCGTAGQCVESKLDATKLFAVCYAQSKTQSSQQVLDTNTWRDSYIRLSMSQIEYITSMKVSHKTTGQIANHRALKVDYWGSLVQGKHVSLVLADHGSTTLLPAGPGSPAGASYNFPCAYNLHAASVPNTTHSGASTATIHTCLATGGTKRNTCDVNNDGTYDETCDVGTLCNPSNPDNGGCGTTSTAVCAAKTVSIDTVDLMAWNSGTETQYAVCYSDVGSAVTSTTPFYDSGIRVTLPEVINMQADSGYSDAAQVCLTMGTSPAAVCDSDFDGAMDDTCARGAICNTLMGTCASTTNGVAGKCDVNNDGLFSEQCATGTKCLLSDTNPCGSAACVPSTNGGCGTGGLCGYQEICTSVGGMVVGNTCDVNHDGQFTETCQVNAQCRSALTYSTDSERKPVFDAAVRNGGCGSQGVCARQGLSVREQTSWNQMSGNRLIETPTSRIAQLNNQAMRPVMHNTSSLTRPYISLVDSTENSNNPCALKTEASVCYSASAPSGSFCSAAITAAKYPTGTTGTDGVAIRTQVAQTATNGLVTILQQSNQELKRDNSNVERVYAVCYAKTTGTNKDDSWRDSYVRVKVTRMNQLIVGGVEIVTTGQIPNVIAEEKFKYTYAAPMAAGKFVAFVDASLNVGLPCVTSTVTAGTTIETHSGAKQAQTNTRDITEFNTTGMATGRTYAACYAEGDGSGSDTWHDSGLRVQLTKIYNVEYSSGHIGPAIGYTASTKGGVCREVKDGSIKCFDKQDTKPREQTSNTLATNRLPRHANQSLTYLGTLDAAKWVSIVAVPRSGGTWAAPSARHGWGPSFSLNKRENPCVQPFMAGGPETARTSGRIQATNGQFTIPQSTLLDAATEYAVCYSEVDGSHTDYTWRDSYIRLKMSKIEKLSITTPFVVIGTTTASKVTTTIDHRTVGQIPNQLGAEQVKYTLTGSLTVGCSTCKLRFVNAHSVAATDANSGIQNWNPCSTANSLSSCTTAPCSHAGPFTITVSSSEQHVVSVDTTKLDTTKVFAVCYTEDNSAYTDSGIRLTVPKLTTLEYIGRNAEITDRTRIYTSLLRATNVLPSTAVATGEDNDNKLKYSGPTGTGQQLAASKWMSLVDYSLNNQNPCVNPAVAAQAADSTHSGRYQADASRIVTATPATELSDSTYYAVCYTENLANARCTNVHAATATDSCDTDGDGVFNQRCVDDAPCVAGSHASATNGGCGSGGSAACVPTETWRDSYIRLRISKVANVVSFGVTHKTTGQIANHPQVKLTYTGSLASGSYLSLVDATREAVTLNYKTFPYPCADASEAFGTSNMQRTRTDSVSGTEVTLSTTDVDSSSLVASDVTLLTGHGTTTAGSSRYYAVCYSTTNSAAAAWADSGVRVTVPEFIALQVNSGYGTNRLHPQGSPTTGSEFHDGTLWRTMTSEQLPTNKLPRMAGQELHYIVSTSSTGCRTASALNSDTSSSNDQYDLDCGNANGKYLSLVATSQNDGDPCSSHVEVDPSLANGNGGDNPSSVRTDKLQAASGTKKTTVDASSLSATSTFAVCYSKGGKLWSSTATEWDDTTWSSGYAATKIATTPIEASGTIAVPYFRDSYIRLTISNLETVTTLGVTHRTYGQVPNTVASDLLDFVLTGDFAAGAPMISLVDSSRTSSGAGVGTSLACTQEAENQVDSHHSGAKTAYHRCVSVGTSPGSTCDVSGDGTYNQQCAVGARCQASSSTSGTNGGCGSGGVCKPIVTDMTTHGLATASNLPASTTYIGVGLNEVLTGSHNRLPVHTCVTMGTGPASTCGTFANQLCTLNSQCQASTASSATNGGCGSGGVCVPKIQQSAATVASNNALSAQGWFAMCYKASGGSWADSGIRLTVSRISTVRYGSGHDGVPPRDHTSLLLPTNRLPRESATTTSMTMDGFLNQQLTYLGDMAATKQNSHLSLVDVGMYYCTATAAVGSPPAVPSNCDTNFDGVYSEQCVVNARCDNLATAAAPCGNAAYCQISKNPCVNGVEAARQAKPASSGPKQATNSVVEFQTLGLLDGQKAATIGGVAQWVKRQYALCYDEAGDGSTMSVDWKDSYIRFQLTDVGRFVSKGVTHRTVGQLPHHKAALVYDYIGRLAGTGKSISLVKETLNTQSLDGFSTRAIPQPCTWTSSHNPGATASSSYSGKAAVSTTNNVLTVKTLDTTPLDTTATFALCYAEGDGLNTANGGWQDSGIRLTVSSLQAIVYSGYLATEAHDRNKKSRTITSRLNSLQPYPHEMIAAPVLPKSADIPFRYSGPLGMSQYVSIVEVSQSTTENPCVDPQKSAANAGITATGPVRACKSAGTYKNTTCLAIGSTNVAENCDVNGDGVYDERCVYGAHCNILNTVAGNNGGCGTHGGVCGGSPIAQGECQFLYHPVDNGATPDHSANKEVFFSTAVGLTTHDASHAAKTFTLCYYDAGASGPLTTLTNAELRQQPYNTTGRTVVWSSTSSWRDSYIRMTFSEVTSLVATGVTHTDHGQLANHEEAFKLPIQLTGTAAAATARITLVDQTLGIATVKAFGTRTKTTAGTLYTNTMRELNDVESMNEPCQSTQAVGTIQAFAGAAGVYEAMKAHRNDHAGNLNQYPSPTAQTFSVGANGMVNIATAGLDANLTYAVCYQVAGKTIWHDTGLRVNISQLHTLRDNKEQIPLLKMPGASHPVGGLGTSRFLRDLTSSRAKIGRSTCLNVDSSAVSECDVNEDGVFNEPCAHGALCDPSNPMIANGGCGGTTGVCASGISSRTENNLGQWLTTVYNTGSADLRYNKIRQSTSDLVLQYVDWGYTGIVAGSKVSIVDTRLNYGDPCVLKDNASATETYHCSAVSADQSHTCDADNDSNFNDNCVVGAYCLSAGVNNGGCGSSGACTLTKNNRNTNSPAVRQTGAITATSNYQFTVPGGTLQYLDADKTYALCYEATGTGIADDWRDAYVRFSVSKVAYISSHEITHKIQGHIASNANLRITYGGTAAAGGQLSLVDELVNGGPCTTQQASASGDATHSGAATAASGTRTVEFNTLEMSTEKNFAVCYKEPSSSTWHDSGIRVTISRVQSLQYNRKATTGSQQGTVDYFRRMTSTNTAPATDTYPVATNTIPTQASIELYNSDLHGNPLETDAHFTLVEVTANSDKNPCVDVCDTDPCNWNVAGQGVNGAENADRSGVVKAGSTGGLTDVFTITQATTKLDDTKLFAVCYAQKWLRPKNPDGVTTSGLWAYDRYSFRDSYIRLKPSRIYTISTYGIHHYTWGDVAAKERLTVDATGLGVTSISLVDETLNNQQPCLGATEPTKVPGTTNSRRQYSGVSADVYKCGSSVGGSPGSTCDIDRDGAFAETCIANAFVDCASSTANSCGCGTGTITADANLKTLKTMDLSVDRTFAVCYENSGVWYDAGIRLKTPKVQSITYGAPARVITAESCFQGTEETLASCQLRSKTANAFLSAAHYQIGAIIPRADDVKLIYGGPVSTASPSEGTGLPAGNRISLVEQTTSNAQGSTAYQTNNPCRNALQASAAPPAHAASKPTNTAYHVSNMHATDTEGGMRLHSGTLTAPTGSMEVTVPQVYDLSAGTFNRLDYTKTYAVCYSDGTGTASTDPGWRDSYIRVTLSKIATLSMVHTGNPYARVDVTTVGTFIGSTTLEVEWLGSLLHNQWLRLTRVEQNTAAPCDKAYFVKPYICASSPALRTPANKCDQNGDGTFNQLCRDGDSCKLNDNGCKAACVRNSATTASVSSLGGSRRLTLDTVALNKDGSNEGVFAVCYATDTGATTDTTWHDSSLRIRLVSWTNPAKHRVVSGAPVRLSFGVSAGRFDTSMDKVAFLRGRTDCTTAPAATVLSDGINVKRTVDYVCTTRGTGGAQCDSNFDGSYTDNCQVGSLCNPANGCGSGGSCEPTVQLPTRDQYAAVQDTAHAMETPLQEGYYGICVCLGSSTLGASSGAVSTAVTSSAYGAANGNGGCDNAEEWTLVSSSHAICTASGTSPSDTCDTDFDGVYNQTCTDHARCDPTLGNNGGCGQGALCDPGLTLKVISEPQLGRFADVDGQLTVRHVAGMTLKYHIKTASNTSGFEVQNGDKLYFVPQGVDCGYHTRFSGDGTWTYNHATNSYDAPANHVPGDRRWRSQETAMCTAVSANAANNCDANYDGVYGETCVQYALCDLNNVNNGGCGSSGTCTSTVPSSNTDKLAAPLSLAEYDASAGTATFDTPTSLTFPQTLTACFATSESIAGPGQQSVSTDYVKLTHGLEVIPTPRFGPLTSPGHIHAIENSSPSFVVNSLKPQDLIYFVPQNQTSVLPMAQDCTPYVCTLFGGSDVSTTACDADRDGTFAEPCTFMTRCDPSLPFNGGCGTSGSCARTIPTSGNSRYTAPMMGMNGSFSGSTAQLQLPTATGKVLNVPPVSYLPKAWYLVACFIPAGAVKDRVENVKQLDDRLTIFKEPTDALVTSWFQHQVHELRFTQPQTGYYDYTGAKASNFATGQVGDIVVLQKSNCTGANIVNTSGYGFGLGQSAKFTLEEAGNVTTGDEKGGTAKVWPLATGKVNELSTGIYKICYATASSEGESQVDFKMLGETIEILPTPATKPSLSVPRTVFMGQDIVVSWASNHGLQDISSKPNSWIGLFEAGACATGDHDLHTCWKAYQFIAARNQTGTVIFSQSEYMISGLYEVRYFDGDTRNGQGEQCNGLQNVNSETYVTCHLTPAATSETINVQGTYVENIEDVSTQPGLEAVFGSGGRGRYHRQKLT